MTSDIEFDRIMLSECIKYIMVHSNNLNHPSVNGLLETGINIENRVDLTTKFVIHELFNSSDTNGLISNIATEIQNHICNVDIQTICQALSKLLDNNLNDAVTLFFVKVMIAVCSTTSVHSQPP